MNPVLRTLELWTTHQDYLWFLAVLAWSGVIAAEFRRREDADREIENPVGWRIALAASFICGALVELVLLAQDLKQPYTRLDAAMGTAQAGGIAALVWAATTGISRAAWWRGAAGLVLAGLAAARVVAPTKAGVVLALAQALAVLVMRRRFPAAIPGLAAILLVALPVIATHGPWAYAIRAGRRVNDWSQFALFAAGASLACGVVFAVAAWRRRLRETVPDGPAGAPLRRVLRLAMVALVVWLVGGVLLAVWYGRIARRAFEENLLRRVETAVLALDQDMVADALGPELRITSIKRARYPNGRPVDVATVPRTSEPVYVALRAQLARIQRSNPDIKYLYLLTPRQGQMLMFNCEPRRDDDIRHVIHHPATPADFDRFAARKSFLEGPVTSDAWEAQFSAKAPLFDPVSNQMLGWLVADVFATRWLTTFTQARLQTMVLVGAGVGLWALAVAYRLRREARDSAEQKAAAAHAADRMKSAFLAKVSHELRTPIQSVLGYGEMLANAPLSEQHRAWLAALRSHGDIMLRLVNDLIDLGALQSGSFRLESAPVGLHTVIDECTAALRPAADAKALAFRVEIDPTVPPWVRADGVRLRQVLLNLLNNAIKFTPSGSVTLRVQCAGDALLEFVVTDTGPGIPAELRSRLFQPFMRLDPAAGGGSGLGLALVQGLCMAMKGTVELAEDTATGATFIVRLPLARCEPPTSAFAAETLPVPSRFAGLRVLVAEDNTLVRELLMAFLAENGAEVMVAPDGPKALELARERAPDVLLLDVALPGLDGIAVAEQLRREGPRYLRIIGLSAHASRSDETRARGAGMDVFLAKPVRLAALADAITGQSVGEAPHLFSERVSDDQLRARLLAQFATETPRVLAELRASVQDDWPRARSRAHYLKNSADVLGDAAMRAACQRLASLEQSPGSVAAQHLVDAIEAAIPSKLLVLANIAATDQN